MELFAIILALLPVACSEGPLAPPIDPATIQLQFAVRLADPREPATTSVEGTAGEIIVHGSIVTGQHGYQLHPTVTGGGGLQFLVTAGSGPGHIFPAHYRYEARLLTAARPIPADRCACGTCRAMAGHGVPRHRAREIGRGLSRAGDPTRPATITVPYRC